MAELTLADKILNVFQEGLSLWRTWLEKKKELYELHLTKERNKALDVAEQSFDMMDDFIQLTFLKCKSDSETHEILEDLSRAIHKNKKLFDKLD